MSRTAVVRDDRRPGAATIDGASRAAADRIVGELLDAGPNARAVRLDALRADDPALHALVASLLAHLDGITGFLEAPIDPQADDDDDAGVGTCFGHWRATRTLGRGGMGLVFEVERADGVVRQRAALKLIRRGLDNRAIVARFTAERQILAALDDPRIARLIDAGEHLGRPYLVMEFVDGVPIDRWCADRALSIDARIALFGELCGAVHYAHQRLVVHRDLKPGNILVTADGIPKLLDFGISKLLDAADGGARAETVDAQTLLTPRYASPEQLGGTPISTASDVYSLGVVLFELLTGTLPYRTRDDSLLEMMRAVLSGSPTRASTAVVATAGRVPKASARVADDDASRDAARRARRLRGDLDLILAKALAKVPADRYESAAALRDDLARHLAGEPILAAPPSWPYRARKFVGRHRVAVAFAASMAIAITVLGVVASREAIRAERARDAADVQRALAERRFDDTRRLAKAMLFELDDAIAFGPTKAREQLVRTALVYLDRLSQDRLSPDLQRDVAAGYERISQIVGNGTNSNLGRPDEAQRYLLKALAIREQLARDEPDNRDNIAGLLSVNRTLGSQMRLTPDVAARYYDAAIVQAERLAASDPGDVKAALELFNRRADALTVLYSPNLPSLHRLADALAGDRALVADMDRYRAAHPDARQYPNAYERVLFDTALLERNGGEREASLATSRRLLAVFEDHLRMQPDNPVARRGMAITLRAIGDSLVDLGRIDEAVPVLQRSIAIRDEIVAADPANVRARRDLGVGHSALGYAYDLAGRPADALPEYRQWLKIADETVRRDPALVNLDDRETARWSVAEMQLLLHRPAEALADARLVERNLAPKDVDPTDDQSREALGNARLVAGRSLAALGSATAGYATAVRGASDLAAIAAKAPQDAIVARDTARAEIQAGFVGLAAGPAVRPDACRAIAAGRDTLTALDAAGRLNPAYRIHLERARKVGARCDGSASGARAASR